MLCAVIIFILILTVVAIIIWAGDLNQPAELDHTDLYPEYGDPYSVSLPWGWEAPTSEGDTLAAVPIEGASGSCSIYTFIGEDLSASVPIQTAIAGCASGVTSCYDPYRCTCFNVESAGYKSGCIDQDQMGLQGVEHKCLNTASTVGLVSGSCLRQDGTLSELGGLETYFNGCSSFETGEADDLTYSTLMKTQGTTFESCDSQLSLIAWSEGCLASEEPDLSTYYLSTEYQAETQVCDLSRLYGSFPLELFRVFRYNYDGTTGLVAAANGQVAAFESRQWGYYLMAPVENTIDVIPEVPLTWRSVSRTVGAKWLLAPPLAVGEEFAPQQIVYTPDITQAPGVVQTSQFLDYCKKQYSIQLNDQNLPVMRPYRVYQSTQESGYVRVQTLMYPYLSLTSTLSGAFYIS